MARGESGRKAKSGSPLPEVPDKLYFRIGEVARLLALPAYVLRFWESEFPQLKPGKGGSGQRLYRRRDLDMLLEIRRLLYDQGYTIPGARQFLKERSATASTEAVPASPAPSQPTPSQVDSSGRRSSLDRLRADLLELASLLGRPVAGMHGAKPAHRGLHLAARKRIPGPPSPTLFSMPRDPLDDDQG